MKNHSERTGAEKHGELSLVRAFSACNANKNTTQVLVQRQRESFGC